jgi:alpha-glucosidase
LKELRCLADAYPHKPVLVGEVYLLSTEQVARYLGVGDQLHLAFDFTSLYAPWDAGAWRATLDRVAAELGPIGGWPTWTLSNHDNTRHRTRYGSEERARAAAVLLLTLRGTPFLYAGEELGLEDALIPQSRVVDPGGRDGCRAPVPWTPAPDHGWGVEDPWLPWPPDPQVRNAEVLQDDPRSILHLYRRLLAVRRGSPALRRGGCHVLPSPDEVVAYERQDGDDHRRVLVNFSSRSIEVPVDGHWVVEVSSAGAGEGEGFDGVLPGDTALLLCTFRDDG